MDTNILLSHLDQLEKEDFFFLSSVSINELEEIKTNRNKTEDVRYSARKAVRFLNRYPEKYGVVVYDNLIRSKYLDIGLDESHDVQIIKCAAYARDQKYEIKFVSDDILARIIARDYFELDTAGMKDNHQDLYKGYIVKSLSDDEIANIYNHMDANTYDMCLGQYLIVKNLNNETIQIFKWTEIGYDTIIQKPMFKSNMLGTLKPLDDIQRCAIDSIVNNDITVLYGRAGSGKTTLTLNYAMKMIEKENYKKCHIVYSYETLKGAKTLGYEKGDHLTKLLYSGSIGNILASKFGDLQQVEYMIERNMLDIIPTANIRGVEFESDSIVIVTEAQNLDVYTLKTIIQRCKDGCKQIYEGDIIEQKDTDLSDIGINRLIDVFKGHPKFGCLKLKNNYRGELTELADRM